MPENKKNNMTERMTPGAMPDFTIKDYENIPLQFEGTVPLPIKAGDLDVEWELRAPAAGSTAYAEKGKRGFKFTKEGGRLAALNWEVALALSGPDADLETIRANATRVLGKIAKSEGTQPEFTEVLKRSFEVRFAYMEKEKFWAEMEASNSPWNEAIETIAKTVYPEVPLAFVKNFATHAVRGIREEIRKQVEGFVATGQVAEEDLNFVVSAYEARVANHIARKLVTAKPKKLQKLREQGVANLASSVFSEKRFTKYDPEGRPLPGYMAKTLEGVLAGKGLIAQIRAEDLTSPPEVERQPTFRERLAAGYQKFRHKVRGALPTFADKRRVVRAALAVAGVSMLLTGSNDVSVTQVDVARAFANQPSPITQQVSPDMELALSLSSQDEKDADVLAPVVVTPTATVRPTETATPAPAPTAAPEATPTVSPTPEAPFVVGRIDFANEESPISLVVSVNGTKLEIPFTPIVYKDGLTPTEAGEFLESFSPGKGTAAVDRDNDDNLFLFCHSGYSVNKPLECEGLRQSIEGGSRDPNTPMLTEAQRQENMRSLVGQVVQVEQGGGVEEFVISAVGYIPHDRIDEFDEASLTFSSLDVLIDVTGGENSPFEIYRGGDRNAVLIIFCGWGPRSENNWWVYSRYAVALEPVEQVERFENVAQIKDAKTAVQVLADAINTADERGFEHGEVLSDSIENQLKEKGVEINEEMEAKLRKLSNETANRDLQCVMGTELTARLPGTEGWVDIGGLPITRASDLFYDRGEKIQALNEVGRAVSVGGTVRTRVDKVSMLAAGDVVATDFHPSQPDGHVARVVDVWIDNDGKYHALIFDVNFANDGRARLIEITDENMDEMLANVAQGESARIIAIRTYKSHEALAFAKTKIQH